MSPLYVAEHRLKTPRAAAIAGILFSVLLLISLELLFESIQTGAGDTGDWLKSQTRKVAFAVNLIPFAGIAFLWFVGVMRDRLGSAEDRLFATVFLGSGLLFISMLFVGAAMIGGILISYAKSPANFPGSPEFRLARSFAYYLLTACALKMAGVFMVTASTMVLRTGFTARWTAIVGYVAAAIIIFASPFFDWTLLGLPIWVSLISANILVEEFRRPRAELGARAKAGA
jgi:hypothetical protein